MDPVTAALFMMAVCVPLMFVVIGIFAALTKLLVKMFPVE